ncbi:MAG: SRPBCC family protein [Nocardioidaceae bacterium]|nr:SRPBCC family protein [Nocardioidaceae bacterium]
MDHDTVSAERIVPAPPEAVFAMLSDASRHSEFDGSGTVRGTSGPSEPLRAGSVFGMSMNQGFSYSTQNTVIEFEQDRRIAWQTTGAGLLAKVVGGRIWRYELEPTEGGGTRLRETWDLSQDKQRFLIKRSPLVRTTRSNIDKTLARIEEQLRDQGETPA